MVVSAEAFTLPSFWFSSSSRFPLTFLPTHSRPLRLKATAIRTVPILASLRSLRPRPTGRPNHLRRKLLKTLPPPPPHPVQEAPHSPLEGEASFTPIEEGCPCEFQRSLLTPSHELPTDGHALVLEEEEELALVVNRQPFHPNHAIQSFDVPRLLLELAVYVVGLLAVQTVCAIWLFGGAIVEKGGGDAAASSSATTNNVTLEKGKAAGPSAGDHELEFERRVSAIRAMAREARAAEAREASEKDEVSELSGDVTDEVNRRLSRLKKRMPRVHLGARVLSQTLVEGDGSKACKTSTKGFNGKKGYAASTRNLSKGGAQQIGHDFHLKEPTQLHTERKSSALGYNISGRGTSSSLDQVVLDFGNSQTFGNLNPFDQGMTEESRSDHNIAFGGMLNNIVTQEVVQESSPIRQVIHYEQSATSNKASGGVSKTKNMGTPHSESFLGKKLGSFSTYRSSTTNSEVVSNKKTEHGPLHEKVKDSQSGAVNQLWWLKLPYVLAIFLHRGYDRKEYKGLYSLKLDSHSEEGSDSYTIVFQDRVDATNFCYLLESFFENLDDFSADIVPLSIQEVHDAVKSKALKVIVVRKGQLQLYAGQPLAEAEMQLRVMLG